LTNRGRRCRNLSKNIYFFTVIFDAVSKNVEIDEKDEDKLPPKKSILEEEEFLH